MTDHDRHPAVAPAPVPAIGPIDPADADRLDDALEALRAGRPLPTTDPHSPAVATASRVHRFADAHVAPRLSHDESTLIWEDLMRTHLASPSLAAPPAALLSPLAPSLPVAPSASGDVPHRRARLRLVGTAPAPVAPSGQHPTAIGRPRSRSWSAQGGWPLVELLGVAAIILGIVAFIVAGSGGQPDAPAVIPLAGVGTATPGASADEVAALPDSGNTGVMPGPGIDGSPEVLWRVPAGLGLSGFTVADGVLVRSRLPEADSAGESWSVEGWDTRNGTPRWTVPITAGSVSVSDAWRGIAIVSVGTPQGPTLVGGVSLGDRDQGYVIGLDVATGELRWATPVTDAADSFWSVNEPTVAADGTVYVTATGRVTALDALTGAVTWAATTDGAGAIPVTEVLSGAAVADGIVTVYSSTTGSVYAYDAATGDRRWARELPGQTIGDRSQISVSGPAMADGRVYLTSTDYDPADSSGEQAMVALDGATGAIAWTRDLAPLDLTMAARPYGIGQPYIAGDTVVVSLQIDGAQGLAAFSASTGEPVWEHPFGDDVFAQLAIVNGVGYAARVDGLLTGIDLATGAERWSLATGGQLRAAPFVIDGVIYQASESGLLYAIGGNGEVPSAATPTAATAAAATAATAVPDISGLPGCDVAPRDVAAVLALAGSGATPAASLAGGDAPGPAFIRWADVPVGRPADAGTVAAVRATVDAVTACARAGTGDQVAAFFTEGYFLGTYDASVAEESVLIGLSNWIPVMTDDIRTLDDGRAMLITGQDRVSGDPGDDQATMYLFAEQPDGTWLIDEIVLVNDSGLAPTG